MEDGVEKRGWEAQKKTRVQVKKSQISCFKPLGSFGHETRGYLFMEQEKAGLNESQADFNDYSSKCSYPPKKLMVISREFRGALEAYIPYQEVSVVQGLEDMCLLLALFESSIPEQDIHLTSRSFTEIAVCSRIPDLDQVVFSRQARGKVRQEDSPDVQK
ncbi:hypothetical protein EAF00_002636 [Botryotinia globosa]|nr:hypothetical protein EAF00_002636 [Botryotinia globosa]